MNTITHKNCVCARGIKIFNCIRCGKESDNYMNGIDMCKECCKETNTCQICGIKLMQIDN